MRIFSSWVLQSLVTAKPNPKTERFNPHPPGVIREGSVTHAVLLFLKTNKGKRFSTYQIIHSLGCSEKAASCAFIYLRRTGLVEVCPD